MELRTFTPQKLFVFSLIVAILFALPIAVKAETGTIYWQSLFSTSKTPGFGEYNGGFSPDWTKIDFDNADYNTISNLTYNSTGGIIYAQQSNWTSFTITGGGSGTGLVTYSRYLDHIQWVFSSDTLISGSPIVLTYSYPNFFNDISINCGVLPSFGGTATGVSTSFPAGIETTAGGRRIIASEGTGCDFPATYTSRVGQNVQNSYNITYSTVGGTQFFATNLTKPVSSVSAATKDKIESATLIYEQEATFNNNAFTNYLDQYSDGIYLNVSVSSGDFRRVLVNSSGTPAGPTPPGGGNFNPPLTIPASGGSIQFNQTKYVVGDTARVEWAISNSDWNGIGQTFIINFFQNNVSFLSDQFPTGQIPVSSQTGNYSFIVNQPSVIQADLDGGFIFATNVLGSAYTTFVAATPAYISLPSNAVVGQNVTIKYGFAAGSTVNQGYIVDSILDDFGIPIQTTVTYTNLSCPCTSGTKYKIFNAPGKHKVSLFDGTNIKTVASATIQISSSDQVVPLNITTNSLTLDNSVYNYNDVIIGSYQISTVNYSAYNYFSIALVSSSGIYANSISIPNGAQTGQFQMPVNSGAFQTIQSGAAYVNLTAQSSALNNTLVLMASVPVTINANSNGYSVSASPQTICKNDPVYVKYTGAAGVGDLRVTLSTPALTTKITDFNFSSNGTKTFTFPDGTVHDKSAIQFDIYDAAGNYQVGTIVKYQSTDCTQAGVTPTVTGTPGQVQSGASGFGSFLNNLIGFMLLPAFWGTILFLMAIIVTATNEKASGATGMVALIFSNVEAIVGLWSPFTMYILVVTWVIAGIYFTVGRKTTTQN